MLKLKILLKKKYQTKLVRVNLKLIEVVIGKDIIQVSYCNVLFVGFNLQRQKCILKFPNVCS